MLTEGKSQPDRVNVQVDPYLIKDTVLSSLGALIAGYHGREIKLKAAGKELIVAKAN